MLIYHYLSGFIRNTQLLGKTQIYKCSGKHTPRNDMLNQSPLCILFQSNLEASGLASILGRQTGNGGGVECMSDLRPPLALLMVLEVLKEGGGGQRLGQTGA